MPDDVYGHPNDHLADHLVRIALALDRRAALLADQDAEVVRLTASIASIDDTIARRAAVTLRSGVALPIVTIAERCGLDTAGVLLLVAAALPGLDIALADRWRQLVGSVAPERRVYELVDLLAMGPGDGGFLLAELAADRALQRHRLVRLASSAEWTHDAPLLQRLVSVPDCVADALRGTFALDPRLELVAARSAPAAGAALSDSGARLAELVGARAKPVAVVGPALVGKATAIAQAGATLGRGTLVARLDVIAASGDALRVLDELQCVARLLDDVLVLRAGDGIDALPLPMQHAVIDIANRGNAILTARTGAIVRALRAPHVVHVAVPDAAAQSAVWRAELGPCDADIPSVVARCSLPIGEILEAAAAARSYAAEALRSRIDFGSARARPSPSPPSPPNGPRLASPSTNDLIRAARERLQHRLSDVASVVTTTLGWDDLIVRDEVAQRIHEIISAVHHREHVLHQWGFADKLPYGRSVSALLSGPPGTGKTMVATLIAKELGLELFRIDLSKVVSKWLGETEKNLGKVFDEAARVGAVLLFDEADALFAKRTEVKSSNDRNANLEVNYLLQRLENHDGIVLLTTNAASGIDEAFRRRLRFRIEFPTPDPTEREALWRSMIPARAPLAIGVDLSAIADRFDMAGGHIKNAVVRAAFLAAQAGATTIDHDTLVHAATLEWTELGNLPV